MGWKIEGIPSDKNRYVLVCAPHSSNWDLVILLSYALINGLELRWLGKKSLFKFPFGTLMRWLGGISIDRNRSGNAVDQLVDEFKKCKQMVLAVAPEGTRGAVTKWRSGFYWIAHAAGVPLGLAYVDYSQKKTGLGKWYVPSGDFDADLAEVIGFYAKFKGRRQ